MTKSKYDNETMKQLRIIAIENKATKQGNLIVSLQKSIKIVLKMKMKVPKVVKAPAPVPKVKVDKSLRRDIDKLQRQVDGITIWGLLKKERK